jgi:type II secretion system protein H
LIPSCPATIGASARGFTLLELMVVLALLAIAGALIAPNLRGMAQGRGVEEESRRLLTVLRHARDLAVSRGERVVLTVDDDGRRYGLREGTSAQERFVYTTTGSLVIRTEDVSRGVSSRSSTASISPIRIGWWPDGTLDENAPATIFLYDGDVVVGRFVLDPESRRYRLEGGGAS